MKQGQGFIRFVTIAMLLISLYYLSFTFVGTLFSSDESAFVKKRLGTNSVSMSQDSLKKMANYYRNVFRDSFSEKPYMDFFLWQYDYKNIKKNEIKLGLDLQGGMSFVMEVQVENIIRSLSNNSKDPNFNQALQKATAMQQNSQDDYLTLLAKAYKELGETAKLAPIFAGISEFDGKIAVTDNNDKAISVLRTYVNSSVQNTFNVIKNRTNKSGLTESQVSLQENTGRIIVELPGADDLPRIKKLLEASAKLEFDYTYDISEVYQGFIDANEVLKGLEEIKKDTAKLAADTSAKAIASAPKAASKVDSAKKTKNPLFEIFSLNVDQKNGNLVPGPIMGYALVKDIDKINGYLATEQVKNKFKSDVRFLWSAQPVDPNGKVFALYAIKMVGDGMPPLTGEAIASANRESDQFGKPAIGMIMTPQGASTWEKMTDLASSDPSGKKCIAIVLDNVVYSAPTVQNKISGGRSQISGKFTNEEAIDLSNILNSGKIDAPAKIIQEELVGPTLGQDTIKSGILSLIIGLIVIFVFMVVNYRQAGMVADIALITNLLILLGFLSSKGLTLTLPGIAGIVLIIGAAVDANVIIYERVKEELRNGRTYLNSLIEGYKHSYWTIIDANATTLITSLSLMFFGFGPIKGFAVTLTIGIFTSLFTAVLVTRELFNMSTDKGKEQKFGVALMDKMFMNSNFGFISRRKIAYMFSTFFIVVGLVSILTRGFDTGVDFKGGRSYVVTFDKNVDAPKVRESLNTTLDRNTLVKTYGDDNQVQITTSFLYNTNGGSNEVEKVNDSIVMSKIYQGVNGYFTKKPTYNDFVQANVSNFRKIDATIADDIKNSSFMVSLIALLGIFIYVAVRFSRWQFAAGAIVALIHDLFFTLGILSLLKDSMPFSLEMNQSIIAAVLTIIGFSTNDTVVIFDRIREFLKRNPNDEYSKTFNDAINATLSRTVMTATTLFIVSLVLFVFGGESIKGFSFTMLVGIIVGTVSSIFVASPVALDLINFFSKNNKK
jgi:SecD/SecF fusion protein